MGAYKRGEIKAICEIVKPDIAVITGISEQHLALFGSIENTLKSKYEIVEYSQPDAIVVLNGDNDVVLRIASKSAKKEVLYSTSKELDLWASDIKSSEDKVEFNVHYKGRVQRFKVRILGEHNVGNILGATAVALQFGMGLDEISDVLEENSRGSQIGRLSIRKSRFGYKVVDDSYNSNPDGFAAALDFLDKIKGRKKILVTIGILELGAKRRNVYRELSKRIVRSCDVLLTTDKDLVESVQKLGKDLKVVFERGVKKQLKYLKEDAKANDVVLFEGPNLRLIEEVVKK
jgi:UDP-N-acetylmuramoyl-tripeptide--D-alanyl-D-alanine ligase